MNFKKHILDLLQDYNVEESQIETPPNPELGDFAFPCFTLSKQMKKDPKKIAEELSKKLKPDKYIKEIKATGAYLNFFVNKDILSEKVLEDIYKKKGKFGEGKEKKEKTMIEFSSPNTNKPLHLGHLRNICLGDSVSRIYDFLGYKVIKSCLVNDKGIHICKSMIAYKKFGENKKPDKKGDHFVGDFYVMYNKKLSEYPELEKEAQVMLLKWEQGDKQTVELWKRMNSWVFEGFDETYKKLGIKFDKMYYESDLYKYGKEIIINALENKKDFLAKEEGAIVAKLEKYNLPDKVLIRADGTSIYMTQDIYLAKKKHEDYDLVSSVYVVASEQNLHFNQLFKILELLGFSWAKKCHHLSYGMVNLPEGKMKSREGTVVDGDDIIEEMKNLAREEIKNRFELSDKELEKRAELIALGALKFFLLKIDAGKDMTYDPKESISFEGETGPYVQYTHARICSILRKHGEKIDHKIDFKVFNEMEHEIIKQLSDFEKIVQNSGESYRPNMICRYLLDLSQQFNEYYHKYPVLKEEDEIKKARLLLISCIKQVLENGLNLLGIEAPEAM
jgi:arginyl-tRNA synthetase